jgi:elongation factor Ts
MAVVTPHMVKELREMTLAGMSDCKKALDAAEGDMEKAVVFLREKGLANAAKKADRAASEGVVSAVVDNNTLGFVFEVNCETDFVTKNDGFQKFVSNLQNLIVKHKPLDIQALLSLNYEADQTVKNAATSLVATIGENINVRRFARIGSGKNFVGSYVHGGGKMGVLVELIGTGVENHLSSQVLMDIAKDVALQIAAMKPQFLAESHISAEVIKSEESIIRNKFLQQGKPEAALAKIIPSSLKSWFKEVCLTEQLFVKDDSKTVAAYVAEGGKKLGINDLKINSFVSLELGEGVEKKTEDFAAEVAATIAAVKN